MNGVNGVILLPNDWAASTYTLNKTNSSGTHYNTNIITVEDWSNVLEVNGAVFLPAAGDRYGTLVDGSIGYYWSSSYRGSDFAYNVFFFDSSLDALDASSLYHGYSVRLVHSVE